MRKNLKFIKKEKKKRRNYFFFFFMITAIIAPIITTIISAHSLVSLVDPLTASPPVGVVPEEGVASGVVSLGAGAVFSTEVCAIFFITTFAALPEMLSKLTSNSFVPSPSRSSCFDSPTLNVISTGSDWITSVTELDVIFLNFTVCEVLLSRLIVVL